MAFGVTGFAALRLEPQPQLFQALSLGAHGPVPPAPPYGTPNKNLVPVTQPNPPALPANLTLAAQPVFQAILHINNTIVAAGNPPVNGAPNTTSSVGANNPHVNVQLQGAGTSGNVASPAQGPISFGLTVAPNYVTSGEKALQETPHEVGNLDHELQKATAASTTTASTPASSSPQYVPPSSSASVAKIVSTVSQLAVSAVYPAPIFSFAA